MASARLWISAWESPLFSNDSGVPNVLPLNPFRLCHNFARTIYHYVFESLKSRSEKRR